MNTYDIYFPFQGTTVANARQSGKAATAILNDHRPAMASIVAMDTAKTSEVTFFTFIEIMKLITGISNCSAVCFVLNLILS